MLIYMLIINILLQPAILWIVLYYTVGVNAVPNFRPFIIVYLLISIVTGILGNLWGLYAIVPNFVIFAGVLSLFYRIEIIKSVITVTIFYGIMILIHLIEEALTAI
ncbi:MAG: hypothetical protein K9N06_09730 [Candidatus Cloacimonetes bacterium]|nr:hypothetical protein [Candidatus Cloacimonadota bacterium]